MQPLQTIPRERRTTTPSTPMAIRRSSSDFGHVVPLPEPRLEVFFDGACPLCRREVAMIRARDVGSSILFTDISAPDFDAARRGFSAEALAASLHAILPDGRAISGVEVFRQMYARIGYRKLVSFSRLPVVSQLLTLVYRVWAKNRLRLTGRCRHDACQAR